MTGTDHDPNDLIGRVKSSDARLTASMAPSSLASSVIYGDTAYDVVDGFIGEPPSTMTGAVP